MPDHAATHAAATNDALPDHPAHLWRNPEPRRTYDIVIVGGGGHGLATAYYLAKNHGITNVAVLERGWLAGGNIARNTAIIRSNYPDARVRSPLGGMALSGRIALSGGIALPGGAREVPFLSQIDLRVDPTDAVSMTAVAATLGFTVPTVPDSVAGIGDLHALWLGPDEWLVVGRPGRARELEDRLRAALSVPRADAAAVSATLAVASVVDISANRTTIELAGSSARELLEAGCPIDLHPRAFGPGRCAQTLLARANVIVWQTIDEPLYRLLVRPSFGAYVAAWLLDAASGI